MNYQSTNEIKATVTQLDEDRRATQFRDPDRPDGRFIRPRDRQPPELAKARARVRTDRWRSSMDRRRAPTAAQIGMALITALAKTESLTTLTAVELDVFNRALIDLRSRGFDLREAKRTLRRLRSRLVDPADRAGEPEDSVGGAVVPGAEQPESAYPF